MTTIDWTTSELYEQLALHAVPIVSADQNPSTDESDNACLHLTLAGLDTYAQSWGLPAATWLVLSVIRLLKEILQDYPPTTTHLATIPPDTFIITALEDHQQEIGHRCLTGYQEIYAVLARTHRKPSSPFWHRRAIVQQFPELILDVQSTGTESEDILDPL